MIRSEGYDRPQLLQQLPRYRGGIKMVRPAVHHPMADDRRRADAVFFQQLIDHGEAVGVRYQRQRTRTLGTVEDQPRPRPADALELAFERPHAIGVEDRETQARGTRVESKDGLDGT